jgi:hypothetical protein
MKSRAGWIREHVQHIIFRFRFVNRNIGEKPWFEQNAYVIIHGEKSMYNNKWYHAQGICRSIESREGASAPRHDSDMLRLCGSGEY